MRNALPLRKARNVTTWKQLRNFDVVFSFVSGIRRQYLTNKRSFALLAQLEEQWPSKPLVVGSSPTGCVIF